MNEFDDFMRGAADDLRTETEDLSVPDFAPRASGAPIVAGMAVAVLVIAGFFGLRSLVGDDGSILVDSAQDGTTEDGNADDPTNGDGNSEGVDPTIRSTTEEFDGSGADFFDSGAVSLSPIVVPPLASQSGSGPSAAEPDFSTQMVRISDAPKGGSITPAIDATQTFSNDGSLFILYQQGSGHVLYNGDTLAEVGLPDIASDDVYNFSWHPTNSDLVYFPDYSDGESNRLVELNVRRNERRVVHTFAECDSVGQGESVGSTANGTAHMGLICFASGQEFWATFNISTGEANVDSAPNDTGRAPVSASNDGALFAVIGASNIGTIDAAFQSILIDPIPVKASASGITLMNGAPTLIVTVLDSREGRNGLAVAYDLNTGARMPILDDSDGFPVGRSAQIATTLNTGAVALSTRATDDGGAGDVYQGEVLLITEDMQVARLGRPRMSNGLEIGRAWGDYPIVALDPLGRYVLFSSDFESGEVINTFAFLLNR